MIVDEVRFRESICRPCNELVQTGYIDVKTPTLFGNLVGQLRFSNYLPEEEVGKHIMRLRQYYVLKKPFIMFKIEFSISTFCKIIALL